jgi:alpha-beta hydrolase superfamily lysophospholipase
VATSTRYHRPAAGLRVRGTVIVVPGRGETPDTYARFGARLAYDAYDVAVTGRPDADPASLATYLCELGGLLAGTVAHAADEFPDGLVRPLLLAGSDLGAAGIAALVAQDTAADPSPLWWPDGVVLAGLPGYGLRSEAGPGAASGWEEELDVRTRCPVHRGVLGGDAGVRRGALAAAVPDELLSAAYSSSADIPHLLLAGDADPLADLGALAGLAKGLPTARMAVVRGGHHDVLNDLQHRSVAAEIVSFLEALRDDLSPAVAVHASAW